MSTNFALITRFDTMTIDRIVSAYVECALWSETHTSFTDDGDYSDASLSDRNYMPDDLTANAIAAIRRDVIDFLVGVEMERPGTFTGIDPVSIGHDFLLTRNGHGAGFWDRGLGEIGTYLTEMSRPYGDMSLYVGDDGAVHVSGDENYVPITWPDYTG